MPKLLVDDTFSGLIDAMKDLDISLPSMPEEVELSYSIDPKSGDLLTRMEEEQVHELDAKRGSELVSSRKISAYDESVNKYSSLEGTAFLTCHSMISHKESQYESQPLLTLDFYTASEELASKGEHITHSEEHGADNKRHAIQKRNSLILNHIEEGSTIFIDGPLVGAQATSLSLQLVSGLMEKDVKPIFFVKNSNSSMVVDNTSDLKGRFNSDIHWADRQLSPGQRTDFYKYVDQTNRQNAKVFCYVKPFNASPQRVEMPVELYESKEFDSEEMMDMIYYLMIVHGDKSNPQIRPIAIAEEYARNVIGLVDLEQIMKTSDITATINQERFAW